MNERQLKVIIGGLLHDTGKVMYRAHDPGDHSRSGYDFLRDEAGITDREILDQVLYHHAARLKDAALADDSPAYITYIADNIASAADRRKTDEGMSFDRNLPLASIFNILNGNRGKSSYREKTLDPKDGINFPEEGGFEYDDSFYKKIRQELKDILKNMPLADTRKSQEYLNSLLEVLEADLSFIPSSTNKNELADISLYDHVKITAAAGSCIYQYVAEKGIGDLKTELFKNAREFYKKKAFTLFSLDMSGIQAFIYHQYGTQDVLKNLRSRSFYLEIMTENMIDDLLDSTGLSRANLIYSGGGHAYILFPNTDAVAEKLAEFEERTNAWLQKNYKADLYVACGWTACSADELSNKLAGSYREIFHRVSENISERKLHRYSAAQIMEMNSAADQEHTRECRVCHRSDHLTDEGLCEMCSGLIKLSRDILDRDFFTVVSGESGDAGMPLAEDRYLIADSEDSLRQRMKNDDGYVRSYGKNHMYIGVSVASKLWVGDYHSAQTLGELVDAGTGIKRMGVLRADIDNLGQAFVAGFPEKYQTLSRSATFSRNLSLFFKLYINSILADGKYSISGDAPGARSAAIIYSGGDDVFVVGAWKDVLEFAVDLRNSLKKFTEDTLTISAGFGLYDPKYPVSYIASQTGDLEDFSKDLEGKNAISLFDETGRYDWDTFINVVLGEKFRIIYSYFSMYMKGNENVSLAKGKVFLYRMLDLFRSQYHELDPLKYRSDEENSSHGDRKDKKPAKRIDLARMAYALARTEPGKDASDAERKMYRIFSEKMYEWMHDPEESREAVTAIYLYTYLIRNEEGEA